MGKRNCEKQKDDIGGNCDADVESIFPSLPTHGIQIRDGRQSPEPERLARSSHSEITPVKSHNTSQSRDDDDF